MFKGIQTPLFYVEIDTTDRSPKVFMDLFKHYLRLRADFMVLVIQGIANILSKSIADLEFWRC
jgi:hypothetical protein